MSESRLQNQMSDEHDQELVSQNESSQGQQKGSIRPVGRPPGRPRGRGRPKLINKIINKKKGSQQQIQEEPPKTKERTVQNKQQNQIQPYVRIVDYLKKIDCDEVSFQNKMNPYHCLTATCFWYMVSAQYYSYDFFYRNNPLEAANHVLNRVSRLPVQISSRFLKNTHHGAVLQFQTQQVKKLGQDLTEYLAHLIPAPLFNSKPENIEKKLAFSSVTQDNEFISSTRAMLFNYVKSKIEKSDKWSSSMKGRLQVINNLQPKQFIRKQQISFQESKQEIIDSSQLDILSKQLKKKKSQKKQFQKVSQPIIENENQSEQRSDEIASKVKSLNQNIDENIQLLEQESMKANSIDPKKQQVDAQQQSDEIQNQSESQSHVKQKICLKYMTSDEVLLSGILNLPLDKVISILEATLPKMELPEIYSTFMPIPKSDPLEFVFQLHSEEENYLQYLKQYQKKQYHKKIKKSLNIIEQEEREIQFQDAKCQICTDGDYTDDNLIVFCSTCNISLHQRCVGLAKVPAQSWVCDVCLAFGPAGINLPCPLCNVKGGAMKRTNIHIDTNLWKQSNPGYYEYSKKCPYNKQKQQYIHPLKQSQSHVSENKQDREQFYYDYFNKFTYPNDQPACHYVWVHYVCSIWVPECYFEQKNGAINIKGIQNIQKKRYKHQCQVCRKVKGGASVKCDDPECKKYYHPECARKKKVYMEQLNLEKIKYLVFCEEHEPLKLTRQIEYKMKKNRDQIIKFARMIQKYIETYKIAFFPFKLAKIIPTKSFIQTYECEQKEEQLQLKPEPIKQSDQEFVKQIILKLSKVKKISVTVVKTQNGLKILDVNQPSRREMRKCLSKYDDFWHTLQNGESSQQNCRRYENIMKQNFFLKDKMEIFLNGGYLGGKPAGKDAKVKKGKGRGRATKQQAVQTLIEEEGGIFCICRKPYENEMDMFECQICGEWYHHKCIGFIGTQADAQTLQFHCMKCMKFQSQAQKRPRLQKCINFFSPDSLFLNYSPPTPKLMSQEADDEIKEDLELQNKKAPLNLDSECERERVGNGDLKQNREQNIVHLQENTKKEQEVGQDCSGSSNCGLKGKKPQPIDQQIGELLKKSSQLSKGNPESQKQQNALGENINVQVQNQEEGKMQQTLNKFLGSKQKMKEKMASQVKCRIASVNGSNQSLKEKMAELQRSIRKGEYNSPNKK